MIEMQGPGIYLNPPNKPVYQESQTTLPQAVVGVGQGVDYGAIAQSVAQLGTTLVELDIDNKRKKKSRLLDELETKTRMGIDHASAYNDFDSVDAQIVEYKNQVKAIVGYDIDSDEGGQTTNALLEQARKTSYGFELYGQKARRETADDVKMLTYNDDQLSWRESLATSADQGFEIAARSAQLEQMIKDADAIPQKTMGDRAYISALRKDRLDLLEMQDKMTTAGVKSVSEAADAERKGRLNKLVNIHRDITNQWEALGTFTKQIDELAAKKDRTEAEEAHLRSLQIRANATAQQISDFEAIVDTEKDSFAKEYYGQPWSSDLASSTLTPEQYSSVLQANEKRAQTLEGLSFSPYNLMAARQKQAVVDINGRVDTIITQGSAGIAEIDQRITDANSPEEREYLLRARSAFLTRLEQKVLGVIQGGVPPVTKNLVDTVSGFKLFRKHGLDYSVMPDALTAFAADSIESMTRPSETISKVFRPSVDKFNQFLSTRLDIPASKFGGESSKQARTDERRKESAHILYALRERFSTTASAARINEAMIDVVQAGKVNPYQSDNITLRPWSELAPEIKAAGIELPPNGFVLTDFYVSALKEMLRSDDPEAYTKTISTFFDTDMNAFFGGVYAATDKPSMTDETADMLLGGLENPITEQVAMATFLLLTPSRHVAENIGKLRAAVGEDSLAIVENTIKRLETIATTYQGNGDPLQFIEKQMPNIAVLQRGQALQKLAMDKDTVTALVGAYTPPNTAQSEPTQASQQLNDLMKSLRAGVFSKLKIPTEVVGTNFTDAILGKKTNTLMRQVSAMAIRTYHEVLADNGGKEPESMNDMVIQRMNAKLQDFKVATPEGGLVRFKTSFVNDTENALAPTITAGAGMNYDIPNNGKFEKDLILDSNWDHNGLDKVSWNQFGVVSTPPSVANPTAFALAISANNGTQLPSDSRAEDLMAIGEAVLGDDRSNRTMLIAQAAIRGLKDPKSREDAINQVKRNMTNIRAGLDSGEYKFFVSTGRSNLNDKQLSPVLTLRGKGGSTLATMQPAPLRKSLVGTDVHKKSLQKITKAEFGEWAVRQINAGTVDHTKVVDWLTANGKSSQTLSETTQWFSTPIVDIPVSIPNEDYTYELVNHLGKKQWFVTKDGGERVPVRANFGVDDIDPADTVKYVYTGSEGRISRRTGVTTVAGKPLVTFEWKGMGTKWMLDSSRYDTTLPTFTEPTTPSKQEREWETFIRTNVQNSLETQRMLNTVIESLGKDSVKPQPSEDTMSFLEAVMQIPGPNTRFPIRSETPPEAPKDMETSPKVLKDMGTEPTSGDFNVALAAKPFVSRGSTTKYLTTVANTPVVISKEGTMVRLEMPTVKEREVTTGLVDMKDVYIYDQDQTEKISYIRPANSNTWSVLSGPVLGKTEIPKNISEAERFFLWAVKLHRELFATKDRDKQLYASRLLDRATATLGEAKRLKSQPEQLKAFERYVRTEIDQLLK
jgi:hypothetical protein